MFRKESTYCGATCIIAYEIHFLGHRLQLMKLMFPFFYPRNHVNSFMVLWKLITPLEGMPRT